MTPDEETADRFEAMIPDSLRDVAEFRRARDPEGFVVMYFASKTEPRKLVSIFPSQTEIVVLFRKKELRRVLSVASFLPDEAGIQKALAEIQGFILEVS